MGHFDRIIGEQSSQLKFAYRINGVKNFPWERGRSLQKKMIIGKGGGKGTSWWRPAAEEKKTRGGDRRQPVGRVRKVFAGRR
jgi:hypothetical protein